MLGPGAIAPGPSIWSEPAGAVRGTQAGGAVPADTRGAQLRRRAGSVAARGDVEERPGVCVGEVVVDAGLVTGQAVDAGDDRRGDAGAAEDQPARLPEGVVDGYAGVRVGHRRDVGLGPVGAASVEAGCAAECGVERGAAAAGAADRKSTRLNS